MTEMIWASTMLVAAVLLCSVVWAAVMLRPRPTGRRYRDQRS